MHFFLGVWFVAMHDPHPPVATSAADAFRKAFPADKKTKAILFALSEILDYIRETLLVDAQKNFNDNTYVFIFSIYFRPKGLGKK